MRAGFLLANCLKAECFDQDRTTALVFAHVLSLRSMRRTRGYRAQTYWTLGRKEPGGGQKHGRPMIGGDPPAFESTFFRFVVAKKILLFCLDYVPRSATSSGATFPAMSRTHTHSES